MSLSKIGIYDRKDPKARMVRKATGRFIGTKITRYTQLEDFLHGTVFQVHSRPWSRRNIQYGVLIEKSLSNLAKYMSPSPEDYGERIYPIGHLFRCNPFFYEFRGILSASACKLVCYSSPCDTLIFSSSTGLLNYCRVGFDALCCLMAVNWNCIISFS